MVFIAALSISVSVFLSKGCAFEPMVLDPTINKQFPASPSLVSKEVWAERYQTYCKSYSLSNWQAQSAH